MVGEAAEPAPAPVEQEEGKADDHRRKRERQVDDRVHEAAPGKRRAHERERAVITPKIVFDRHRDRRHQERQLERVHGLVGR
mgnify:CR=1 FL=1